MCVLKKKEQLKLRLLSNDLFLEKDRNNNKNKSFTVQNVAAGDGEISAVDAPVYVGEPRSGFQQ